MRTASAFAVLAVALAAGEAGKKVEYDTGYTAYFVKNNGPVKEFPAHLVLTDKKAFDQIFGVGFTMTKPKTIAPNAFEKQTAVVVIKKGNAVTTYDVQQVTAANGVLRVQYQAKQRPAGNATYVSPLIVMVEGREYRRVVLVENGKEVDSLKAKQ